MNLGWYLSLKKWTPTCNLVYEAAAELANTVYALAWDKNPLW